MNEIDQRMQELYLFHKLCVNDNFFSTNPHLRVCGEETQYPVYGTHLLAARYCSSQLNALPQPLRQY